MSFSQAVSSVLLNKYATFSGRARRSEYWWWYLFVTLVFVVAGILDRAIGLTYSDLTIGGGWIATIAGIVFLIPNLAVAVRRLHDTGRTGWWLLIGLVPVIGFFVLLYFFVLDSENDNAVRPLPQGLKPPPEPRGARPGAPSRRYRGAVTLRVLPRPEWEALAAAHEARVDAATAAHRERRSDGRTHPVEDFLFRYYNNSPARLRRWHPGAGVAARGCRGPHLAPAGPTTACEGDGVVLDVAGFLAARGAAVTFVRRPVAPPPSPGRRSWAASGCTSGRWCTASRPTTCGTRAGRCGWAATAPTRWWSGTASAARTSTPTGSSRVGAAAERAAPHPGRPGGHGAARAACTPGWTSTSGRSS